MTEPTRLNNTAETFNVVTSDIVSNIADIVSDKSSQGLHSMNKSPTAEPGVLARFRLGDEWKEWVERNIRVRARRAQQMLEPSDDETERYLRASFCDKPFRNLETTSERVRLCMLLLLAADADRRYQFGHRRYLVRPESSGSSRLDPRRLISVLQPGQLQRDRQSQSPAARQRARDANHGGVRERLAADAQECRALA